MYERNYQNRVLKKEENIQEGKRTKGRFPWVLFFWIFGVLILFSGIIYTIKAPQFQITEVYVDGTVVSDKEDVSLFVKKELVGNYLPFIPHFFPKTSILLANTGNIKKEIQKSFPRFKTVVVKRNTLSSLTIQVSEYQGVYLWCNKTEECSFMSDDGVVFAPAPYFSGNAYLKIFIGEKIDYPFNPISIDEINMVSNIFKKLIDINIDPTEVHFESTHKISFIFIHNNKPTHIYFDQVRGVDNALEVLYTGLKTEPLSSMYRNTGKILEYLDLRFSDKIVYKFQ